jgi:RNA polymerase sigma-70 factor (ECF subfamily)
MIKHRLFLSLIYFLTVGNLISIIYVSRFLNLFAFHFSIPTFSLLNLYILCECLQTRMELLMDDDQAIRRLKGGDISGLDNLVTRYQNKAVRMAFLITQDEPVAEDVVQDVFVRLYQRIHRFDESRPFEPYLMRSVINAALNAVQKEAKRVVTGASYDMDALENLLVEAASVEEQVEFNQCKQAILASLKKLPPRQRAVVVQRYYLGLSENEMSEELKAPVGTVKWLLNAARTRLRALLHSQRSVL